MNMDGDVCFDSVDLWDKRREEQLKGWYGNNSNVGDVLKYINMYKIHVC